MFAPFAPMSNAQCCLPSIRYSRDDAEDGCRAPNALHVAALNATRTDAYRRVSQCVTLFNDRLRRCDLFRVQSSSATSTGSRGMVGRPKSQAQKAHEARQTKDVLMTKAVEIYKAELATKARKKRMGLRAVCAKVSKEHKVKTGEWVPLSPATLARWLHPDHVRLNESSERRSLLNDAEAEAVVTYCEELAKRGFPKSLERLKELVNSFIRTRDPTFTGVGKNWASTLR